MIQENTPRIETQRLILRKFTEDDVCAFFELMSDDEVNTFLPWFTLKTEEEARAFLTSRFFACYQMLSAYRYAICLKENNRPIGYVWLSTGESRDFGYALKKEFWHKGIVTEAAAAVVERIKHAGYTYITATHDINNPRSGEIMKKLGMTYRYSYVEQWQPKDIAVTFRLYQLNFAQDDQHIYLGYV